MLKIGLTGNIGSGKTTVAEVFKVLGAKIYYADNEAKKFLAQPEIIAVICQKFGNTILSDNQIDRKKLASIVFEDVEALDWLNQLIHPLIRTDFENWINELTYKCQYVILEAAILFESGFDKCVDKIILVTAEEEIRKQRVIERDHTTIEMFIKRSSNQWEESRKKNLSDFLIINDDTELIIPQILVLHNQFCELVNQ